MASQPSDYESIGSSSLASSYEYSESDSGGDDLAASSQNAASPRQGKDFPNWGKDGQSLRTYNRGAAFPRLACYINFTAIPTPPSYLDIISGATFQPLWNYIAKVSPPNCFLCPFCPSWADQCRSLPALRIDLSGYKTPMILVDHIAVYHYPFVDGLTCNTCSDFKTSSWTEMQNHLEAKLLGRAPEDMMARMVQRASDKLRINDLYIPPCLQEGMPIEQCSNNGAQGVSCLTVGPFRFTRKVLLDQVENSPEFIQALMKNGRQEERSSGPTRDQRGEVHHNRAKKQKKGNHTLPSHSIPKSRAIEQNSNTSKRASRFSDSEHEDCQTGNCSGRDQPSSGLEGTSSLETSIRLGLDEEMKISPSICKIHGGFCPNENLQENPTNGDMKHQMVTSTNVFSTPSNNDARLLELARHTLCDFLSDPAIPRRQRFCHYTRMLGKIVDQDLEVPDWFVAPGV